MLNDIERLVQNIINVVYTDCSQISTYIKSEDTEDIIYIKYTQENGTIMMDKWKRQEGKQLCCVGTKCV